MNNGVIAFCGSKGAGKSTSYELFKQFYNGDIEEIAFAGHLKNVCSQVFNIDMKYFLDPALKEVELDEYKNVTALHVEKIFSLFNLKYDFNLHVRPHVGQVFETPRKLLQYVGTEILHPIDPLVHAKYALSQKDPKKLTVITDLRFEAEFNYLKDTLKDSFVPVYVKNSKAEIIADQDPHPSEQQMKLFKDKCYLIPNETSKSELKRLLVLFVGNTFRRDENVKEA